MGGRQIMQNKRQYKKWMVTLFLLFTLILPVGLSTSQAAYGTGYPLTLNGDSNYELGYGHGTSARYVDKSSVTSLIYNPPFYRLSTIVAVKGMRTGNITYHTYYFDYNINNGKVYGYSDYDGGLNGRKINLTDSRSKGDLELAKIVWRTAYGTEWNY